MIQQTSLFKILIYSLMICCVTGSLAVLSGAFSHNDSLVQHTIEPENSSKISIEKIEGWNHTSLFPQEFKALSQTSKAYDIVQVAVKKKGQSEISTILIKKLIDTTRQHGNGIKLLFTGRNITIGQFDKLVFELKINPEHLKVPVLGNTINNYKLNLNQVNDAKKLFNGKVYLNVTLFGVAAEEQNIKSIFASKIIDLSSSIASDNFFSVQINSNDFQYYWQQQWQESLVAKQEVSIQKLEGLLITAETINSKTLRHYLPEGLPKFFQEKFIEIPVVLKNPSIYIVE
jgi:hypothetical protein